MFCSFEPPPLKVNPLLALFRCPTMRYILSEKIYLPPANSRNFLAGNVSGFFLDQTIALPLGGGPQPFSIRSLIPFFEPISFVTFVTLLSGSSRNSLTTSLSAGRPRFLFVVSRSLLAIFPSMYVTYLCHRRMQLVTPEIKKYLTMKHWFYSCTLFSSEENHLVLP